MTNKYNILRIPYIYSPAMREMNDIEKLRKKLMEPLEAPRIITFPLVRKALREYYGVMNKVTLMDTIFELYYTCITEERLYSILIEIYLKYGNEFLNVSINNIEADFLNEKYINNITSRFKIDSELFPLLKKFMEADYSYSIREEIENYFEYNKDTRVSDYKFFAQIMTVIAGGVSCFYITKKCPGKQTKRK